jgi:hypothetical protein
MLGAFLWGVKAALWGVKAALALVGFSTVMLAVAYGFIGVSRILFRRGGKRPGDVDSKVLHFWSKN